jgi:hypothetical protein
MANEFDGEQRATLWVDSLMLGQDTGPCKILSTLVRTNIFDLPPENYTIDCLGRPEVLGLLVFFRRDLPEFDRTCLSFRAVNSVCPPTLTSLLSHGVILQG